MNKTVIEKIKKLLSIAGDFNASENEILTATKQANKLMVRHKIDSAELVGEEISEQKVEMLHFHDGYSGYIYYPLQILAEFNRCKALYRGKINTNQCEFTVFGLKKDLDLLSPMCDALILYLNKKIKDLKQNKNNPDFRIYKKSYLVGFSRGLQEILEANLVEEKAMSTMDDAKFELLVVGVPVLVKNYITESIKPETRTPRKGLIAGDAYDRGVSDAKRYSVGSKNLLKESDA
jgi:Protein of unknown function (DUF2786).